ncbi:hypothetical protein [Streptomyces sp. AS02]|uniref:hypothetical protein n=1 Tax=Streptomyces sp. AS02 TaxID=2938946 RepID=UPI0020219535|nr:hypothetical protein [Streptomyces sp. AS02]MCL8016886.1 hypothetical protein [Streptomyces sp. AS02]
MDHPGNTDEINEAIEWTDLGNHVGDLGQLSEFVSLMTAEARHMRVGLSRAAWGALTGTPWLKTAEAGQQLPDGEDIMSILDMHVTPAGTTAKDALLRHSLASLITALDAVDQAGLAVWLAKVNSQDPDRKA